MKRFWMALTCFLIAAVLCVVEIVYTLGSTDKLYNMIAQAESQLNSGQPDSAALILNDAADFWQGRKGVASVFLHHDRIDDIELRLSSAAYACKTTSADAEIRLLELQAQLEQIWRMEIPTPENIF